MKKCLLLLIVPFLSFSQTLNDIPISELDVSYIQIVGTQKFLKLYEATITVNYGQVGKFSDAHKAQVKNSDGKLMTFNGMMDAVNFFSNFGYQLEFAYPVSTGNQNVYHYVMYKPNSNNSNANDVYKNRGNLNSDDLICDCNYNLKNGISSDLCQEFFTTYKLGTTKGKEKWVADLKRLGCE